MAESRVDGRAIFLKKRFCVSTLVFSKVLCSPFRERIVESSKNVSSRYTKGAGKGVKHEGNVWEDQKEGEGKNGKIKVANNHSSS